MILRWSGDWQLGIFVLQEFLDILIKFYDDLIQELLFHSIEYNQEYNSK